MMQMKFENDLIDFFTCPDYNGKKEFKINGFSSLNKVLEGEEAGKWFSIHSLYILRISGLYANIPK